MKKINDLRVINAGANGWEEFWRGFGFMTSMVGQRVVEIAEEVDTDLTVKDVGQSKAFNFKIYNNYTHLLGTMGYFPNKGFKLSFFGGDHYTR